MGLQRIAHVDAVPLDVFVRIATIVFSRSKDAERSKIAHRALQRCLGTHFAGDETAFLVAMLGGVGEGLDGAWAARAGLVPGIRPSLASRNMVAFRKAPQPARLRVVWAMGEVGQILRERRTFDLDAAAAEACAYLIFDAEKVALRAALAAAGRNLPRDSVSDLHHNDLFRLLPIAKLGWIVGMTAMHPEKLPIRRTFRLPIPRWWYNPPRSRREGIRQHGIDHPGLGGRAEHPRRVPVPV